MQISTKGGVKTETFVETIITKRNGVEVNREDRTVTREVSGGPVTGATITLDAGEIRRLNRVLNGHAGAAPVYHGSLTDGFVAELRKALGA